MFDGLYNETQGGQVTLDSATDGPVQSFLAGNELPESLTKALGLVEDKGGITPKMVVDSVLAGMRAHQKKHGVLPTADVIVTALDQVKGHTVTAKELQLDGVGSTEHHDPLSAMPNRIQIGILSQIAEAFPAATYLPVDIGSNQAILGIVAHRAQTANGEYIPGDSFDGVNLGRSFLSSERRATLSQGSDRTVFTGQLSLNAAGGQVQLLRNRTLVYVDGFPCAEENSNYNQTPAQSTISGTFIKNGQEYAIGGWVKPLTGEVNITFAPALAAGIKVVAEGFLDYEADSTKTPELSTSVQTYNLYAKPWRGIMRQTIDSNTQYQNELGLNLMGESLMTARNQVTVERHRSILRKAVDLAASNVDTFNFDYDGMMQQKTRAQIWQDFTAILGSVDQKMAIDTMDRGVTHLYVTKLVKAQLEALPTDLFEKSGLPSQPGIYRLGRLFSRYEVYYTPWELQENAAAGTAQILCLGRSNQPARNTFVMGDAVPLMVLPLATDASMRQMQGLYARNFTSVNPHKPSAMGCALINVTNMFKAAA
ncbi:hypothetical protein BJP27_24080 (plasmid) [Pseudomonas oryzihabitans]|nr:hypothetical protein BJP27_24080 [Pseudomonas psychrotolerans]